MYAEDIALGLSYKYSDEFVDMWNNAYLEGREDWEEFVKIRDYVMKVVDLTYTPGVVMVQGAGGSIKQIHVDNLQLIKADE